MQGITRKHGILGRIHLYYIHMHGYGGGLTFCVCAGIESEWRKTQCMPREVCVDVGREFGAPTNIFYKPPCVSVYRCGGCCHSEDKQCRNISTGYVSKTVSTIFFNFSLFYFVMGKNWSHRISEECLMHGSKLYCWSTRHNMLHTENVKSEHMDPIFLSFE